MLTSRERVLCTLNHEEPDRVPVFLGATGSTSLLAPSYEKLKAHFGLKKPTRLFSRAFQPALVDEEIRQILGGDAEPVFCGPAPFSLARSISENEFTDALGVRWKKSPEDIYYGVVENPLRNASLEDLERYPWPNLDHPDRFSGMQAEAARIHSESGRATVALSGANVFDPACLLRGMDQFMLDLSMDYDLVEALLERITNLCVSALENMLAAAGSELDIVLISDDLGGQNALLISPRMYRKFIKPHHARIVETIHRTSPAKVMMHSCGNIFPIIGDLVEIGVDLLNPVQVSTPEMGDTARLKREFGSRLAFNGAIDTHTVLPKGTPEDVRREVRRRINDLGPGGGYILSAVHSIQPDVPVENVIAMFDEAQRSGAYPLRVDGRGAQ